MSENIIGLLLFLWIVGGSTVGLSLISGPRARRDTVDGPRV